MPDTAGGETFPFGAPLAIISSTKKKGMSFMKPLVLCCEKDDTELYELLQETFDDVTFVEARGFDGGTFILTAIVPITALTVQIVDFIITHLGQPSTTTRAVVDKNRKIVLEGYSANDVVKILKQVTEDSAFEYEAGQAP